MVSELKKRPRPRSPSFTMPVAVMNTLAGLMSVGEGEGGWCGDRRPGVLSTLPVFRGSENRHE